ncbi:MAG TPA: hypothetical protein VFS96_00530 [Nitrolancea sp.]|nr:hypothetical protein [Nitrolancea sp.]
MASVSPVVPVMVSWRKPGQPVKGIPMQARLTPMAASGGKQAAWCEIKGDEPDQNDPARATG